MTEPVTEIISPDAPSRAVGGDEGRPSLKTRLEMALAEAGYPHATVHGPEDDPTVDGLDEPGSVPSEVCWKAFRVARCEHTPRCFDCWAEGYDEAECPHPWPETVTAAPLQTERPQP